MAEGSDRPWILGGVRSRLSSEIASLCFSLLILRSGAHRRCRVFARHRGLFSTQGSLRGCSCDIVQVVLLSVFLLKSDKREN